uniref:RRM domain-containing protein n=1 Tax=Craspedostauros australis TaxID=1486917 RepID=A0A7R9ZNH0_9STRA|mmetsp:Transcript_22801/g.63613  ORF Transcript_22801/g.63613 Transcript_22801/m.63613 type:complete len:183 (+) Transcript_22801:132-680(+)
MSAEATTEEPKKEEPTEKTTEPAAEDEDDEDDVEKLEAEIARMEAEAARITKETEELEKKDSGGDAAGAKGSAAAAKPTDAASKDKNSVYVGQVDYTATPEELLSHFEACGTVERVTIVCDKYSGRPKGFAYIEFGVRRGLHKSKSSWSQPQVQEASSSFTCHRCRHCQSKYAQNQHLQELR